MLLLALILVLVTLRHSWQVGHHVCSALLQWLRAHLALHVADLRASLRTGVSLSLEFELLSSSCEFDLTWPLQSPMTIGCVEGCI